MYDDAQRGVSPMAPRTLRRGCDNLGVAGAGIQLYDTPTGSAPTAPHILNYLAQHFGIFDVEVAGQVEMVKRPGPPQHSDIESGEVSAVFAAVTGDGHRPDRTGQHLRCLQPNIRSTKYMAWVSAALRISAHRCVT
jgi:hypothetical protein